MRTELYHYAMSVNSQPLSKSVKYAEWLLLSISLIPILILKLWVGIIILSSYTALYIFSTKEKDEHNRVLLSIGLFLLFLGLEFFFLVSLQYKVFKLSILVVLLFIVIYEIVFTIKIAFKRYSSKDKSKKKWFDVVLTLVFGGTGVFVGRLIGMLMEKYIENTATKLWIGTIVASVIIVGSVTFLQRYFVNKIINKI